MYTKNVSNQEVTIEKQHALKDEHSQCFDVIHTFDQSNSQFTTLHSRAIVDMYNTLNDANRPYCCTQELSNFL